MVAMADLVEVAIGGRQQIADPAGRMAQVLDAWVVDGDLKRRVGDGESGRDVVERMTSAFEMIADAHPGEGVALDGHAASLTPAVSLTCGLGARVWGTALPHAEPFLVVREGGCWSCPARQSAPR